MMHKEFEEIAGYEISEDGKDCFDFNLVIPRPEIYNDPELTEGFDTEWCIYWYKSQKGDE